MCSCASSGRHFQIHQKAAQLWPHSVASRQVCTATQTSLVPDHAVPWSDCRWKKEGTLVLKNQDNEKHTIRSKTFVKKKCAQKDIGNNGKGEKMVSADDWDEPVLFIPYQKIFYGLVCASYLFIYHTEPDTLNMVLVWNSYRQYLILVLYVLNNYPGQLCAPNFTGEGSRPGWFSRTYKRNFHLELPKWNFQLIPCHKSASKRQMFTTLWKLMWSQIIWQVKNRNSIYWHINRNSIYEFWKLLRAHISFLSHLWNYCLDIFFESHRYKFHVWINKCHFHLQVSEKLKPRFNFPCAISFIYRTRHICIQMQA